MDPVTLSVGQLVLRPWRADDVDAYWAAVQDPLLQQWNEAGSPSRDDIAARLARLADWSAGRHASFAVVRDDVLLGSVSLYEIDLAQGEGDIGYWTEAAARGRGTAVRAVDGVCRWAFAELGIDRVQLFHAAENGASGRVAATAGFTQEGRLRRGHRYGDGVRHDELLWSRLSDDPPPALH